MFFLASPAARPGQGKLLHFGQLANGALPEASGEGLEALALETFSRFWDKAGLCIGQNLLVPAYVESALVSWDRQMDGWTDMASLDALAGHPC